MSHAEENLREVLSSIVEEKYPRAIDVKVKAVSSAGANYSSALYVATIVTSEENVELFAKVSNMGDGLNSESKNIFAAEKYVYTNIATAYNKIQDKHGITDRFVFSKYYKGSVTDEAQIFVMENLAIKGYGCLDRFKCINLKYASKCIETLAKYHALSFALSKEDPDEFKRAAQTLDWPVVTGSEWDSLTDAALAAVDEADREKLVKLFEGPGGWTKMKELGDTRKTAVIIHGDYRASNLMHKETDGEFHVIPVDYQTARLGCPAADLIYFLLLGTDQQFRQQHFHPLVDHYYQQLALAMTRLGLVPEEIYKREEFDSDMKEKLPLGLCTAAMVLPYVLVDPTQAPSFEGERVPRSNELFAERFRGLVQDYKQWGYL